MWDRFLRQRANIGITRSCMHCYVRKKYLTWVKTTKIPIWCARKKSEYNCECVWDLSWEPNIYVSWSTSDLRASLVPQNLFEPSRPSSNCSNDPSNEVLLLRMLFIKVSCLSLLCCRLCSFQPCDYLLGNGWPLSSLVCCIFWCFVTFPYSAPGQLWYLVVSIPDLCLPLFLLSLLVCEILNYVKI